MLFEKPGKNLKDLNHASSQLSEYSSKWKIIVNAGKTLVAFFTRRRVRKWLPHDELIVQGEKIPWKNSIKVIGLTLDKTLTFREHTEISVMKSRINITNNERVFTLLSF